MAKISQLDEAKAVQPTSPADLNRLDALPYLAVNLASAPRSLLYELFEATQLGVRVHGLGNEVTITVRLPVDRLPETAQAAERISDAMTSTTQKASLTRVNEACVVAVCTPDEVRTASTRLDSPLTCRFPRL